MIRVIPRIVLVAAALAALLVPLPAWLVERAYSRAVYLVLQGWLTTIGNRVPFAATDVLLVAAVVVVLVFFIRFLGGLRRRPLAAAGRLALALLTTGAVVYLAFFALWGLNYRREPISTHLQYTPPAHDAAALTRLALDVVATLNRLHAPAHARPWPSWQEMPAFLEQPFERVQQQLAPGRTAVPGLPKSTWLTAYFERAGVDGMTSPFTLEVLVNGGLLPVERPFVTAHEWAHLAGYADEAEANFIGWLVCIQGPTPAAYSGWLHLYLHIVPALGAGDRTEVVRALADGPRADIRAIVARLSSASPAVQAVGWRVYDQYLRANRVEEGIASYGRMLELVLGTQFDAGWRPVRRWTPPRR